MKALVKKKAEPGLWMEEVAVPEVGPNDVLIRVRKAAICGTDIHIYSWDEWSKRTIKTPLTRSPNLNPVTAEPTCAISPMNSWPMAIGTGIVFWLHSSQL